MPFLRITLALILGIFIANEVEFDYVNTSILLGLLGFFNILVRIFSKRFIGHRNFKGTLILFFFIALGAFAQKNNNFDLNKKHFSYYHHKYPTITGKVIEAKSTEFPKYYIQVNSLSNFSKSIDVEGKVLLKTSDPNLKKGDFIKFHCKPLEFRKNKNEYAFDEKRFYNNKGIFHYTYSNEIEILKSSSNIFNDLRTIVNSKIDNLRIDYSSKSIVKAMLLGDKSQLEDISIIFRNTGTSHVLAISGLHVGIIASILFFLCSLLASKYEKMKFFLVIVGVWTFCILSGSMPSTVRASVMITCFLIGKSLGRTGLSYNYCFAAAFIMLLNNPCLIFDIGFQFSFLAIFGILFFYDHIYKSLQFRGILNYIWQLFSVSLAAQIMITPFSLYYFHEFPLLFLITSLLAIPSTFIIIALSSLSLIFSSSIFEVLMLDEILNWFVNSFINLLSLFAEQDKFILKDLFPDRTEVLIYYISLFSISTFFISKKHLFLFTFLASFIALGVYQYYINYSISGPNLVIYSHHKDIMIDVFNSGAVTHFYEEKNGPKKSEWVSKNRRIKFKVKSIKNISLSPFENQLLSISDLKIAIINEPQFPLEERYFKANYLLLNSSFDKSCISSYKGEIIDYSNKNKNSLNSNNQIIYKLN